MAIQGSGVIAFTDIASEFGDTAPHSMSEFIRGGSLVPQADANNNIPTSTGSPMKFSQFYNGVNVIAVTASSGTNLNAQTLFGSSWTDGVPKELIIPSGIIIGSTTTTPALTIPTGMGGTLIVKNSGSIQGMGGAANSGTGGTALYVRSTITFQNNGAVQGGGGGGGKGGTGGQGVYTTTSNVGSINCAGNSCNDGCAQTYGGGAFCASGCYWDGEASCASCTTCAVTNTYYTSGGTGGNGGRGEGYNQTRASGSGGSAGGTNAGSGGTGGAGGLFGASGSTGATGANGNYTNGSAGTGGGLAGYYVNGASYVTWSVTGTRQGRTTG